MAVKQSAVNNSDWARYLKASPDYVPRIFGRSAGDVGSGKTHFWLTAPGPIVILSFDKGLEGVIEPFAEQKPIYLKEYEWAPAKIGDNFTQADAQIMRDDFEKDWAHACTVARTVILDTESFLWELYRYAEFGAPKADVPRDFEGVNKRYKWPMALPKKYPINCGLIQSVKDDWSGATKKTGTQSSWGYRDLDKIVAVELNHYRDDSQEGAKRYGIQIGKCRGPAALTLPGQRFQGITMPMLGETMFPETEEDDWQ